MSSRAVTVLTINGRRQNVKVEPNTTVLEILEQVCQKHNFNAAEYDLKHHNKVMDLSAMFRFSGLPNNAFLEMAPAAKVRTEADVMLVVQLEDGSRLEGTFKPSSSLLDVLKALCGEKAREDANPVMIYMRREVLWNAMDQTTLRSLGLTGGRAIIRLLQRKPEQLKQQANVSAPLPQKERVEEGERPRQRFVESVPVVEREQPERTAQEEKTGSPTASTSKKPKPSEVVAEPGPSTVETKQEPEVKVVRPKTPEPEPEAIIDILGSREAVLFHLETAERHVFDIPDSFFDVTVSDVRKMYVDLKNKLKELEEAPLMTAELRQLEENKRVLNDLGRYKITIIRVQFPDRYVLQGIFKLHDTVADVMALVREHLREPSMDFHLYTTPPKCILPPEDTLVSAKCVPQALLHFGCNTEEARDKLLKSDVYERLSNAVGASKVAARARGQPNGAVDAAQSESASITSMDTDQDDNQEDAQASSSNRLPNANFRPSSVQAAPSDVKMPKWFKPVGK